MNNEPKNYSYGTLSPEVRAQIEEKKQYELRLTNLLEDIRQAALGIDYQTRVHLRQIEKRVISKLIDTEIEIKKIIRDAQTSDINKAQGKLF